jgi:hypothetical protein
VGFQNKANASAVAIEGKEMIEAGNCVLRELQMPRLDAHRFHLICGDIHATLCECLVNRSIVTSVACSSQLSLD